MGRKVLGLDIGITSVGFGIIDIDNNEIVDYGVRLFKESTAAENVSRREKRGGRRLKSRKKNRIADLKSLMQNENIIGYDFSCLDNPYELRVKGLSEKLTNQELATVLVNIVKRRGSSLDVVEDDESKAQEAEKTKKVLQENDNKIKNGKYICEIQFERLQNGEKIRTTNNNFRTKDYVNEVRKILDNQDVSIKFKEDIIALVSRRRMYYEGPGSAKSPTQYGRFLSYGAEPINLIEKMIGKCSIFPEELRASSNSFSACLFNLLNDLNNLTINGEKLSVEEKNIIINEVKENGSFTPTKLCKMMGAKAEDISGFRIDKKDKPLLTEFKGYRLLLKACGDKIKSLDKEDIDKIIDILSKTKDITERKNEIATVNNKFTSSELDNIASISGISGYHSLSYKAIHLLNQELLNTEMNQMQIIQSSGLVESKEKHLKGKKNIKADQGAILSPVAKRAQRETMKVINRLRELHGEFDSIIIETTRDKNSKEEKARIVSNQKYFENINKQIDEKVGGKHINAKLREKIRLYEEQEAKSAYMLKPIDFDLLLSDPTAYEVDHIIPISISLDDSINNKVLVTRFENQAKGNLTPLDAFSKGKFAGVSKEEYIQNTLHLRRTKGRQFEKKRSYLLFEKDITKYSVMKEFINRNLVDTSYANRTVLNTLQDYFKANEIPTKIHTIRGSSTSAFRKKIKLNKDRESQEVGFAHHAIDALIVASLKKLNLMDIIFSKMDMDAVIDNETGEILDEKAYFDNNYIEFLQKLKHLEVNVCKFSHKVDTKPNRSVSDDTIYSTRTVDGKEKVVKKYKDIYDEKQFAIANDMLNSNDEKYLMYRHSPETYNYLRDIAKYYYDIFLNDKKMVDTKNDKIDLKFNPFAKYKEEHGIIRKPAKKGNGPEINSMKYYDSELGNHINISKNYKVKDKKVVLLQISPYRTDFYYSKEEKKYKFITIRYTNVRYINSKKKYVIDNEWYSSEKIKKGINNSYSFIFSMHRDELIAIYKEGEIYQNIPLWKFTATNNDNSNTVEVKPINYYEKKQLMPTIGKSVILLEKYATDVCGNLYKVDKNILKLEF